MAPTLKPGLSILQPTGTAREWLRNPSHCRNAVGSTIFIILVLSFNFLYKAADNSYNDLLISVPCSIVYLGTSTTE